MKLLAPTASLLACAALAGCAQGGGSEPAPHLGGPRALGDLARFEPLPRLAPAALPPYRVPPLLDRRDVYAADGPGELLPRMRSIPPRIYVPNTLSDTVVEIDPRSYRVERRFHVGREPQHVVPSYDMRTLWVNSDLGNSLTAIDPRTGRPGRTVHVTDPYNLYFTPDGRYAVVMAERYERIDFRDAHTMRLQRALRVPSCPGVNHADFTANGRLMLASCEYGGRMVVVDVPRERLVKVITLRPGSKPQDVKLSPDGHTFYVADMVANGVWEIDARRFRRRGFLHTGIGTHGLYASRDSRYLYASNRGEGSISLISFARRRVVRKWHIPGGGSPDMGGVSTDGKVLWLSGRYDGVVYAISTRSGRLIRRIRVDGGPHGLAVFPQPGRYSLGHTGVFR
jgi:DNA-binding beta-propeller fold protein YncE